MWFKSHPLPNLLNVRFPPKAAIATEAMRVQSALVDSRKTLAAVAALLLAMPGVTAEPLKLVPPAGEHYEIRMSYETWSQESDGSSGSSKGHETILERVIAVEPAGLVLEYDLAGDATAEDRARQWRFPVRVKKPAIGPMELLNGPELDARVDAWLKKAGLTRAACGRYMVTWTAFRIDCDPQDVIGGLEAKDLRSGDFRAGAAYRLPGVREPGILVAGPPGPEGATLTTVMEIDPAAVRRARAESDVVLGEIMSTPISLDAALRERVKETVTGTVAVTFDVDAAGNARRRTKVTKLQTRRADGTVETETATETVERRLVSTRAGDG